MNLTRDELCLIQQALGLREMTIINANPLTTKNEHLMETKLLRIKIINQIRVIDQPLRSGYCVCHRLKQDSTNTRLCNSCRRNP